jgi:hypothetical protein
MAESFFLKQRINRSLSTLSLPLLFLIAALVLFIFVSKTAYSKFSEQLKTRKELSVKNEAIEARIEDLSTVSSKSFPDSEKVLTSFPEEEPALWMLAQIRAHSEEYSLNVGNQRITFSAHSDNDLAKTIISFNLSGDPSDINQFLLSFDNLAPISSFSKVVYAFGEENEKGATVELFVYHSRLPEEFPRVDEPVRNLTPDEEETIQKLAKMQAPTFTQLSPNSPFELTNPF